MDNLLFVTILLVTFTVCVFFTWYFSHRARTKERLILLEKGVDIERLFNKGQRFKFPWLKLGVLIIGVGVAFGIIDVLDRLDLIDGNVLPFSVLALCAGTSLLIANYLDKGKS